MRFPTVVAALALLFATPAAAAAPPLVLKASVEPRSVGVGDPFVAQVEAAVAAGVDAEAVRVEIDPGPFTALAAPSIERLDTGTGIVVRATQRLACLALECVPGERARTVVLPPARARVDAAGGAASAAGPRLVVRVVPRVPAAALKTANPPFHRTTVPSEPAYRISPDRLAALCLAAAAVLALLAAGLVAAEVRRRQRTRAGSVDPLARAIRLLRESAGRSTGDRRRAAGLLSRVLGERGATALAAAAGALAWSPPPPEPGSAEALARTAEEALVPAAGEGP